MGYLQKIKIIYALHKIVADVKSLDAAISYIKNHWSNYSGEWIDINDPRVESDIRKIYQNIVKKPIYRMVRLDNPSEFDENDLGIYWTYIKDKAKAYWGYGRYIILITAKVTENDIDWIGTVECQLRAKTAGEEEVRLKENAKPKIIKIEQRGLSKANYDDYDYMQGNCCEYAAALHRVLNYKMVLISGTAVGEDGESNPVIVHALGEDPKGLLWDFDGEQGSDAEAILDDFVSDQYMVDSSVELENPIIKKYSSENDFWKDAKVGGATKDNAALQSAMKFIKDSK